MADRFVHQVETLTEEDVADIEREMGLDVSVPEEWIDEVLDRAVESYQRYLDESDIRYEAISEAISTVLERHDREDDGQPPHTDWKCPRCGNRDDFSISCTVTTMRNVHVSPEGWDIESADIDGTDIANGATLACEKCGFTAPYEVFEN